MTWQETHERWQALREIQTIIDESGGDELPWNERYLAMFGDRAGLLRMLEYRWRLTVHAQLDPELPEPVLRRTRKDLADRHAGVLRVLARYADLDPVTEPGTDLELGSHA